MVQGLKHIHSSEHAHLDIKIDNIFLDDDLQIKIADFGYALRDHRYINVYKGSSFYRAPEIVAKVPSYDGEKADVFALGCTLYTLIFRAYPFGNAKNIDVRKNIRY